MGKGDGKKVSKSADEAIVEMREILAAYDAKEKKQFTGKINMVRAFQEINQMMEQAQDQKIKRTLEWVIYKRDEL
jgi:hypothetical protein